MHFMMTVAFENSVCFHCRYRQVCSYFWTLFFDAELFCSDILYYYFGYISLMCLLAVYVIVHGCVKVYERLSFIYVAIYLNKKSTPEIYFCV